MASRWNTNEPPHRKQRPVKIRYNNTKWEGFDKPTTGNFVWSDRENTWLEVCLGPDGIGLYKEDGWKVIGWRD